MWLLAYWWQGAVLLALYVFIYLLYKEMMKKDSIEEPYALILVKKGPIGQGQYQLLEGEMVLLYSELPLEMQGDKIIIQNNDIFLITKDMPPKKILFGEDFDYAGGSLQLVRWKHARQFIN